MQTSTSNKKSASNVTEEIFHILHKFFGGNFHFGVNGFREVDGQSRQWSYTVANLMGESDELRNAELADVAFCRLKNREGLSIFVRPSFEVEENYILFDDLSAGEANRYSRKPGTLVVCSSPGKFQVWLHSDRPLSIEEKVELIKKAGADQGAHPRNRWGRCPGFRNYKPKYAPLNPMARLNSVTEGLATFPKVEIVKAEIIRNVAPMLASGSINIRRDRYEAGDESKTDFRYTLALLRLGASNEEISSRIMNERKNWNNKSASTTEQERYVKRTIEKASMYI